MKRLLLPIAMLVASPAFAAQVPCELHVWPAQATGAVTAGVLSNFGLIGAYADHENNRDATLHDQVTLIQTLTLAQQAQAVVETDLPHLLGMGQVRLIFQTEPIDPRTAPRQGSRLSESAAPCYAELIVSLNEYRDSAVRGDSLKTTLTFKDFRAGAARITSGSEASALHHFPARKPEQEQLAKQDVSDAFAANLRAFARKVARRKR